MEIFEFYLLGCVVTFILLCLIQLVDDGRLKDVILFKEFLIKTLEFSIFSWLGVLLSGMTLLFVVIIKLIKLISKNENT